jgi:CRP/FNR family transcriptional regulator, cyclic AMP receptor protein
VSFATVHAEDLADDRCYISRAVAPIGFSVWHNSIQIEAHPMTAVTSASRSVACLGEGIRCRNRQAHLHFTGHAELADESQGDIQPEGAMVAGCCSVAEARTGQIRDALADSDVFGALADDELDGLIKQGRSTIYSSGAVVFRTGDPAEELMIVLDGRIKISSASANGNEMIFDFIGAGRCLGECALLDAKIRRREATAVKLSAVFALCRANVLACLEQHPEVAVRIIRVLCERLNRAIEMFEDRTQLGLSSRTARALLRLAREYGSHEGQVVRIGLKISQSELAALVGATREKVNRQLCAWCRSGILAVDEGHWMIYDPAVLHRAAKES